MEAQLTIKLVRSLIGRPEKHRLVLQGLGLTKMNKTVVLTNTPEVQGMIKKVSHMVAVIE
jgi:large subunit ribosomal protein L30